MLLQDIKNLKRFNDIIITLSKYGFDEIVDRFDVPKAELLKKITPVDGHATIYERIRLILEDLGPTFIKLGQIMSLRPDLLPRELLEELARLQDDVAPFPFDEVEEILHENLGPPISRHFATFHSEPLAAASISQVHLATLKNSDQQVVVKVQRPGIRDTMLADLDILETISGFLHNHFDDLQNYNLPDVVKTVRQHLLLELDYLRELDNTNIARSYADSQKVIIPKVYKELSSRQILVMDYVDGLRFKEVAGLPGQRRKVIAENGLHATTRQVLQDGFFHADPHPGNMILMEDDRICLIDWGMVGRLTENDKLVLFELLSAIVDKDSEKLASIFLRICKNERGGAGAAEATHGGSGDRSGLRAVDRNGLERALLELLDRYHALPLAEMRMGDLLGNLLSLLNNYQLQLPFEYVIMIKAMITADGSARLAYPQLNIVEDVGEQIRAIGRERFRPQSLWKNFRKSFAALFEARRELPRQLVNIIEKLEQGELGVTLHLAKIEELVHSLESASNRLTIGIITGSVIMGSSMIITTGVGPFLFGYPALGVLGYLLSVVLGLWLIITIFRGKRY